ncbi:MAG: LamG-like jellyroll fold domain-containing protein [Nanoarchaeota archaeon]
MLSLLSFSGVASDDGLSGVSLSYQSRDVIGSGGYTFEFLTSSSVSSLNASLNTTGSLSCNVFSNGSSWKLWGCPWDDYESGNHTIQAMTSSDSLTKNILVTSPTLDLSLSSGGGDDIVLSGSTNPESYYDPVLIDFNGELLTETQSPIYNDMFFNAMTTRNTSLVVEYNSSLDGLVRDVFAIDEAYVNPSTPAYWFEAQDLSVSGCSYSIQECNDDSCVEFCTGTENGVAEFSLDDAYSGRFWLRVAVKDRGNASEDIDHFDVKVFNGSWSYVDTFPIGNSGVDDNGTEFSWYSFNASEVNRLEINDTGTDGLNNVEILLDDIVVSTSDNYHPDYGMYTPDAFEVSFNSSSDQLIQHGNFQSKVIGVISDYVNPFRFYDVRLADLVSDHSGMFNYTLNAGSGSHTINVTSFVDDASASEAVAITDGVRFDKEIVDSHGQSDLVVGPGEEMSVDVESLIIGASLEGINVSVNGSEYSMTAISDSKYNLSFLAPDIVGDHVVTYKLFNSSGVHTTFNETLHVRSLNASFSYFSPVFTGQEFLIYGDLTDGYDDFFLDGLTVNGFSTDFSNTVEIYADSDSGLHSVTQGDDYTDAQFNIFLSGNGSSTPYVDFISGVTAFNDSTDFKLDDVVLENGMARLGSAFLIEHFDNVSGIAENGGVLHNSSPVEFNSGFRSASEGEYSVLYDLSKYPRALSFHVKNQGPNLMKLEKDDDNRITLSADNTTMTMTVVGQGESSRVSCSVDSTDWTQWAVSFDGFEARLFKDTVVCNSTFYKRFNTSEKGNLYLGGYDGVYSGSAVDELAVYEYVKDSFDSDIVSEYEMSGSVTSEERYNVTNLTFGAYDYDTHFLISADAPKNAGSGKSYSLYLNSTYGLNATLNDTISLVEQNDGPVAYDYGASDDTPPRYTVVALESDLYDRLGLSNATLHVDTGSGFVEHDSVFLNGTSDKAYFVFDTTPYSKGTVVDYYIEAYDIDGEKTFTETKSFEVISPYQIEFFMKFKELYESVETFFAGTFSQAREIVFEVTTPSLFSSLDESSSDDIFYNRSGDDKLRLEHREKRVYDKGISKSFIQGIDSDNVVAYWSLDDGEGATTFKDHSGNGNDGICSGDSCPTYTSEGVIGGAYEFDGVDDYIKLANFETGDSVSLWFKADSLSEQILFASPLSSNTVQIKNGKIGVADGSSGEQTINSIQLNTWYNLVIVKTNNSYPEQFNFYLNGQLWDSQGGGPYRSSYDPLFGARLYGGSYSLFFDGIVDDVVVFNKSLSESNIKRLYQINSKNFNSNTLELPSQQNISLDSLNIDTENVDKAFVQTRFSHDNSTWTDWQPVDYSANFTRADTTFLSYLEDYDEAITAVNVNQYVEGIDGRGLELSGTSVLQFNDSVVNPEEGTAEFWVKPEGLEGGGKRYDLFDSGHGQRAYYYSPITEGLVGHWKLDDGAGATTFEDFSGNGNDGTCSGDSCPTYNASGKVDGAFEFDGVDDYVSINDDAYLNPGTESITFGAWVKPHNPNDQGTIINKREGSGERYTLEYKNSQFSPKVEDSNGNHASFSSGQVKTDVWQLFIVVLDRSENTLKGYINENKVGEADASNVGDISPSADLKIGTGWIPVNGSIDDVMIFNRSLSEKEISHIYKTQKGLYLSCNNTDTSDALKYETELPENSWNHLSFSWSNSSREIYHNGSQVAYDDKGCEPLNSSSRDLSLGSIDYEMTGSHTGWVNSSVTISFTNATNWSYIEHGGSASAQLDVANKEINFSSSGTFYNATIYDSNDTALVHLPVAEGEGDRLYSTISDSHATMNGIPVDSFWNESQDEYHYNLEEGFTINETSGAFVPASQVIYGKDALGNNLTNPPSNTAHNGAETVSLLHEFGTSNPYSPMAGRYDNLRISEKPLEKYELSYYTGALIDDSYELPYELSTNESNYLQYRLYLQSYDDTPVLNDAYVSYIDHDEYESDGMVYSKPLKLNKTYGDVYIDAVNDSQTSVNVQFRTGKETGDGIDWGLWNYGEPDVGPFSSVLDTFTPVQAKVSNSTTESGTHSQGLGIGYRNWGDLKYGGGYNSSSLVNNPRGAYIYSDTNTYSDTLISLDWDDSQVVDDAGSKVKAVNVSYGDGFKLNQDSYIELTNERLSDLRNNFSISMDVKTNQTSQADLFSQLFGGVKLRMYDDGTVGFKAHDMASISYPSSIWRNDDFIFIGSQEAKQIIKLRADDYSFVSEVSGGYYSQGGMTGDESRFFVRENAHAKYEVYDHDLSFIGVESFPRYGPGLWSDGEFLYGVRGSTTLVKIDLNDYSEVVSTTDVDVGGLTYITGDDDYLYVTDRVSNTLSKLDKDDLSLLNEISESYIYEISGPVDGKLFVRRSSDIHVYDTDFNRVQTISDANANTLFAHDDSKKLYLLNNTQMSIYNVSSLSEPMEIIPFIAESSANKNNVYDILVDENHIYFGSRGNNPGNGFRKLDKTTFEELDSARLSHTSSFTDISDTIIAKVSYGSEYFSTNKSSLENKRLDGIESGYVTSDDEYLFSSEQANDRILKLTYPELDVVSQIGTTGSGEDQFNNPGDLWTDGDYLYIIDRGNDRIVKRSASDLSYVSETSYSGLNYIYTFRHCRTTIFISNFEVVCSTFINYKLV